MSRVIRYAIVGVLLLWPSVSNAALLRLDFMVDVHTKILSLQDQFNPDLQFLYSLTLDPTVINTFQANFPNGNPVAYTGFASAEISNSPFTSEVLSEISVPLPNQYDASSLSREFGSNIGGTFESIFLITWKNDYSGVPSFTTHYQRGIQRQEIISSDNVVQIFDEISFEAYLRSLIGDENFQFGDASIVSLFQADGSGRTVDSFGYYGNATLLSVSQVPTAVPSPAALPLFAVGLGGLGLMGWWRRRRVAAA